MRHDFVVARRRHWFRLAVLAAFTVGCTGLATARHGPSIPPGFLAYPPYNGFVFEAVHLLPARHDHLNVVEVEDDTLSRAMEDVRLVAAGSVDDGVRQAKQREVEQARQARLTAVPTRLVPAFKAMQVTANGDAAYVVGKDLPEAIRLYTAAAVDFRIAHPKVIERRPDWDWTAPPASGPMDAEQRAALDKAIPRFRAVLELPDAAQPPRAVAAAYMLGRSYALRGASGDAALAEEAFVLTRKLAHAGLPDPDGLAVASFGDQARLRRAKGDLASTLSLYAEQAARGSVEGVESLKWVAQALYDDPQGMAKVEDIPLGQRLLIAYALETNDDGLVYEYVYTPGGHPSHVIDNGSMDLLVRTAKQWPKEKIAWPDKLAALAYRTGDFDFVRTLIKGQDTALAWWLRAKLLVADGKLEDAEAAYKRVVAMSPATPDPSGLSPFNESAACAEMVQLQRARGEFIPALDDQVACDAKYPGSGSGGVATYLAERVLTTAELQGVVARLPPDPHGDESHVVNSDRWMLNSELAKRLVREGRYKEAIAYANSGYDVRTNGYDPSFDTGLSDNLKTQRDLIRAYATAHDQIEQASSAVARAAAWYQLALLTRVQHSQVTDHDSPLYKDKATPDFPGVSSSELVRLKNNYKTPDQDNLHWYIAFDDALKAAQLVPPRSQAYAAILCHAGHWMTQAPEVGKRDPDAGLHQAWRLYVKHGAYVPWAGRFGHHCPDPDFKAAARPAWLHALQRLPGRIRRHSLETGGALGSLVLVLAIGGWLVRRKTKEAINGDVAN